MTINRGRRKSKGGVSEHFCRNLTIFFASSIRNRIFIKNFIRVHDPLSGVYHLFKVYVLRTICSLNLVSLMEVSGRSYRDNPFRTAKTKGWRVKKCLSKFWRNFSPRYLEKQFFIKTSMKVHNVLWLYVIFQKNILRNSRSLNSTSQNWRLFRHGSGRLPTPRPTLGCHISQVEWLIRPSYLFIGFHEATEKKLIGAIRTSDIELSAYFLRYRMK